MAQKWHAFLFPRPVEKESFNSRSLPAINIYINPLKLLIIDNNYIICSVTFAESVISHIGRGVEDVEDAEICCHLLLKWGKVGSSWQESQFFLFIIDFIWLINLIDWFIIYYYLLVNCYLLLMNVT